MTMILVCGCSHAYQDKVYGKGKRVHNQLGPKKKGTYRCTVCVKEKTI